MFIIINLNLSCKILVGKTSNYAIVMAKLLIDDKDHGIHAFVVPLRSLEDHRTLPSKIKFLRDF